MSSGQQARKRPDKRSRMALEAGAAPRHEGEEQYVRGRQIDPSVPRGISNSMPNRSYYQDDYSRSSQARYHSGSYRTSNDPRNMYSGPRDAQEARRYSYEQDRRYEGYARGPYEDPRISYSMDRPFYEGSYGSWEGRAREPRLEPAMTGGMYRGRDAHPQAWHTSPHGDRYTYQAQAASSSTRAAQSPARNPYDGRDHRPRYRDDRIQMPRREPAETGRRGPWNRSNGSGLASQAGDRRDSARGVVGAKMDVMKDARPDLRTHSPDATSESPERKRQRLSSPPRTVQMDDVHVDDVPVAGTQAEDGDAVAQPDSAYYDDTQLDDAPPCDAQSDDDDIEMTENGISQKLLPSQSWATAQANTQRRLQEVRAAQHELADRSDEAALLLRPIVDRLALSDMVAEETWSVDFPDNDAEIRLQALGLKEWLELDAHQPGTQAWLGERTVWNIVALSSVHWRAGAWCCDISRDWVWLSSGLSIAEKIVRLETAVTAAQQSGTTGPSKYPWPAASMPTAKAVDLLVVPVPMRYHWVAVAMAIDRATDAGVITVYDSLYSDETYADLSSLMPLFATLIGLRPGVNWRASKWVVNKGDCTRQTDGVSCGIFTADTCRRLLEGKSVSAPYGDEAAKQSALKLRLSFLREMCSRLNIDRSTPISSDDWQPLNEEQSIDHMQGAAVPPAAELTTAEQIARQKAKQEEDKEKASWLRECNNNQMRCFEEREPYEKWVKHIHDPQAVGVFAAPMIELVSHFQMLANEKAAADNAPYKDRFGGKLEKAVLPLTGAECPLPEDLYASGYVGLKLKQVLDILPESSVGNGWAEDVLLDLLVGLINRDLQVQARKAYLVPPKDVSTFMGNSTVDADDIVKSLEDAMTRARNFAGLDVLEDWELYPASRAPADSNLFSFVFYQRDNHWTHVYLEVNEARTVGKIGFHNSMEASPGKTSRYWRDAQKVAPCLAELVSMRPALQWQNVNWQTPEELECPKQQNTSDCGFFSVYFARQTALGDPVTPEVLRTQPGHDMGHEVRWAALDRIFPLIMGRPLGSAFAQNAKGGQLGQGSAGESTSSQAGKTAPPKKSNGKAAQPKKSKKTTTPAVAKKEETDAASSKPKPSLVVVLKVRPQPATVLKDADPDADIAPKVTHSWRADVRQIACNIMVEEPERIWPESVLVEAVLEEVEELAEGDGVDIDGEQETVRARTREILVRSGMTFASVGPALLGSEDEGGAYTLHASLSRRVDTNTQKALLSEPCKSKLQSFKMKQDQNLTVSVVRDSDSSWDADAFSEKAERAKQQMEAYWRMYGDEGVGLHEVTTYDQIASHGVGHAGVWTSYCYNDSSTEILLARTRGQKGSTSDRIRQTLAGLNDSVGTPEQSFTTVTLLIGGPDGGSSNNETWASLRLAYPKLQFHVVMVVESSAMWHPQCFRIDPLTENGWASFDMGLLADMHSGTAEAVCDHHHRFLVVCNLVQYFKLDQHGTTAKRATLAIKHTKQNALATALTYRGRKSFALHPALVGLVEPDELEEPDPEPSDLCKVHRMTVCTWQSLQGEKSSSSSQRRYSTCCGFPNCGISFKKRGDLLRHRKTHERQSLQGEKSSSSGQRWYSTCCDFPNCGISFKKRGDLLRHRKTHEDNLEVYPCDFQGCGKKLSSWVKLRQHLVTHRERVRVPCDFQDCTMSFKTRDGFLAHKKRIHGIDYLWASCNFPKCEERFASNVDLQTHKEEHGISVRRDSEGGLQKWHCSWKGCDMSFRHKIAAEEHLIVHHLTTTVNEKEK